MPLESVSSQTGIGWYREEHNLVQLHFIWTRTGDMQMIYVLLNFTFFIIEVLIYESIRLNTLSEKISIRVIINSYGKTINLPDAFTFML